MKSKLNILLLGLFFQIYFTSCTLERRLHNSGLHVQINAFKRQGLREPIIKKSKIEHSKLNEEITYTAKTNIESNIFSEMSNNMVEQYYILEVEDLASNISNKQKLKIENQQPFNEYNVVSALEKINYNSSNDNESIEYETESISKIKTKRRFEPYTYLSILGFIGVALISILLDSVVIFMLGAIALIVLSIIGLSSLIESPSQWKLKFFSYLFAILGLFVGVLALLTMGLWTCC